jgi:hypothetical protein
MRRIIGFMAILMALAVSGCGGKNGAADQSAANSSAANPSAASQSAPEKALAAALDALAAVDTTTFNSYVSSFGAEGNEVDHTLFPESAELTEDDILLYTSYFKNLTYKLGDISVDGTNATVNATIANSDFSGAMQELFIMSQISSEGGDDDSFNIQSIADMLDGITAKLDSTIDVKLIKENEQWKLVADEHFINAIYGNLYAASASDTTTE